MKKIFLLTLSALLLCACGGESESSLSSTSVEPSSIGGDSSSPVADSESSPSESSPDESSPSESSPDESSPSESSDVVTPFSISFGSLSHISSIVVYLTQDYTQEGETVTADSIIYARDSETGEVSTDGTGQVNFKVIPESGYEVTNTSFTIAGTYANLKYADAVNGIWRITKIQSDLTVDIAASEATDEISAYTVNVSFTHCTVYEVTNADTNEKAETALSSGDGVYTRETASWTYSKDETNGKAQVNLYIAPEEGYVISESCFAIEGTWNAIKGPSDTGYENVWRITKITSDLTIAITPAEETSGIAVTLDIGSNVTVKEVQSIASDNTLTLSDALTNGSLVYTRDGDTYAYTSTGGQINLYVIADEGYTLSVSGSDASAYKNLKDPASTGIANVYRFTKVNASFTITISAAA